MHYVILRDDDTCALTPVDCLERLYRPFLDRGLPVNLATVPNVRTDAERSDGQREGFLQFNRGTTTPHHPLSQNHQLVEYLHAHPGYHILHHGYDHTVYEFDCTAAEAARRLKEGARVFAAAGFPRPSTFVAPHDRFSRAAYCEVARRYPVISTGWFEHRRLPVSWWPGYLLKKVTRRPHWRAGGALLLSHPGCLLSRFRSYELMLDRVKQAVKSQPLTVLVTHWWEYFREEHPDLEFIDILHRTAEFLADDPSIRVITFDDLAQGRVRIPGVPIAQGHPPAEADSGATVAIKARKAA